MKKQLFENLNGEERINALAANAASMQIESIERELSEMQVEAYKNRLNDILFRDVEIEEHLKAVVKPLKEERKDIRTETTSIVKTLRKGFIESEEQVYWMRDDDNRMMVAYDENGKYVRSRKMRPEERQTSVIDMAQRTGTNG